MARSSAETIILAELNGKRGTEAVSLLTADIRVDPCAVLAEPASWLEAQGVLFSWGTAVKDIADGTVHTDRGDFHADKVVV